MGRTPHCIRGMRRHSKLLLYEALFFGFLRSSAKLLLPRWSTVLKYSPCPPARDWGSRVSGLVFLSALPLLIGWHKRSHAKKLDESEYEEAEADSAKAKRPPIISSDSKSEWDKRFCCWIMLFIRYWNSDKIYWILWWLEFSSCICQKHFVDVFISFPCCCCLIDACCE